MRKQIATDMTDVLSQIDLAALTETQQEEFKGWLQGHCSMQATIETALRHGFRVKAQANTYRRQSEYWLRIEDTQEESAD